MPDPTTPTSWSLRLGYRTTISEQTAHGIQMVFGPSFKLNDAFKLSLGLESNFTFVYSESDPETLGRDDIVGEHFEGVRESTFDGDTFTDVSGGLQSRNNVFGMQFIPEIQLMWRPSPDVPIEIGGRAGFIANYAMRHSETRVDRAGAGDHTNDDGCIPGDIYCDDAPIPEPDAGPRSEVFTEDTAAWEFTGRFGPRINFPWADWVSNSAELLFIGNNDEDGGLDIMFRAGMRFTAPLHDNFLLSAEPRYVGRTTDDGWQNAFDLVAGAIFKW